MGKIPTKANSNMPGIRKSGNGVFFSWLMGIRIKCPSGARIKEPPPANAFNPIKMCRKNKMRRPKISYPRGKPTGYFGNFSFGPACA